ncbi:MAG: hypothetical protein UZ22_OP11002000144 [Microgenomates bacterium OLB23]|nr:MAG: hypothetical protein UZ22_OP11002000144 [Microgenomates bacterium OLB23]
MLLVPHCCCFLFFKYGINNDLVMRASVPSLFIVFLCAYIMLTSAKVKKSYPILWLALIVYFYFGSHYTYCRNQPHTTIKKKEPIKEISVNDFEDPLMQSQYMGSYESFASKYLLR